MCRAASAAERWWLQHIVNRRPGGVSIKRHASLESSRCSVLVRQVGIVCSGALHMRVP